MIPGRPLDALPHLEAALGLAALNELQAGLVEDMDRVAKALYENLEA